MALVIGPASMLMEDWGHFASLNQVLELVARAAPVTAASACFLHRVRSCSKNAVVRKIVRLSLVFMNGPLVGSGHLVGLKFVEL